MNWVLGVALLVVKDFFNNATIAAHKLSDVIDL